MRTVKTNTPRRSRTSEQKIAGGCNTFKKYDFLDKVNKYGLDAAGE